MEIQTAGECFLDRLLLTSGLPATPSHVSLSFSSLCKELNQTWIIPSEIGK